MLRHRMRGWLAVVTFAIGCGANVALSTEAPVVDSSSGVLVEDAVAADTTTPPPQDTARPDTAPPCVPGKTQCTNCIDDDGDGLVDKLDPDCTGAVDDDEKTLGLGIPDDPCRPGCAFDGLSGDADPCTTSGACVSGTTDPRCPYDPKAASSAMKCPHYTDACRDHCTPRMPENCDCFGCCWFMSGGEAISVKLTDTCRADSLADETKCPRCTMTTCRSCGMFAACSPTRPCSKYYCLLGCCVPVD